MDLISIIVPFFNRKINLIKCLSSIQIQTYKNLEVVIVNDGSTDKTIIDSINDIYGEKKNLVFQPGLGDGLGYTSFGPSISLAKLNNDVLYWSVYQPEANPNEGIYTLSILKLNEMDLKSTKNKDINLTSYSWEVEGAPAPLLRKLLVDLNDLINDDYSIFVEKVKEIDDVFEVQLSPMSDFSKFKNKEPDFVLNYICNLGKYIPEN